MTTDIMELIAVPVHGHTVFAGEVDGTAMVPLRPIVEVLGLNWKGQHESITKHPTYGPTVGLIPTVAGDGKLRDMLCMPLEMVRLWLGGIHPNKVAPAAKQPLIAFQLELAKLVTEALVARRYGLPAAGSPPIQGNLFEIAGPQAWLSHPEIRRAVEMRAAAMARRHQAIAAEGPWMRESVAIARRFGLRAEHLMLLVAAITLPPAPPLAQPSLPFMEG
jgi:hypothetical protein